MLCFSVWCFYSQHHSLHFTADLLTATRLKGFSHYKPETPNSEMILASCKTQQTVATCFNRQIRRFEHDLNTPREIIHFIVRRRIHMLSYRLCTIQQLQDLSYFLTCIYTGAFKNWSQTSTSESHNLSDMSLERLTRIMFEFGEQKNTILLKNTFCISLRY